LVGLWHLTPLLTIFQLYHGSNTQLTIFVIVIVIKRWNVYFFF